MKNIKVLFIAFVVASIVGVPFMVGADTVSDLRQQLQTVLNRIEELKKELALVESGIIRTEDGNTSCVTINQNLKRGDENEEVRKLQLFLAQDPTIYPEGIVSGYFGSLTERAVQRWQTRYGVISYGTAESTGYGVVGPKTRAAISDACNAGNGVEGADNVISFSFTTPTGQAPFNASVNIAMLESACMSYQIDWGDGSIPTTYVSPQSTSCGGGVGTVTATHTYALAGTYTATLFAGKGNIDNLPQVTTAKVTVIEGQPYVKVLSPNGGETLKFGDNTTIKWQVANQPADSAVVFYIVGPTGTYRFAKRSHRSQEFNWIVGDRVCDGNGCNVQLPLGSDYKIRAAMYTPALACIDFCNEESVIPTFLATDESDETFTITQLGSSGSTPLTVSDTAGKAPFTTAISVKLAPVSGGAGNFEIDFGDGAPSYRIHIPAGETRITERIVSHTYANAGNYYVRLRPVGAVQYMAEELVTVTDSEFRIVPKSQSYAPVTAQAFFNVDNSCSYSGDITRVYTIDWGDNTETSRYEKRISRCGNTDNANAGQLLNEKTFTHNYTKAGVYRPKLTVAVDGVYNTQVETITIEEPTLSVSPSFGFKPLTTKARFTADESCVMGDATNVTYSIDWGDGTAKSEYTKQLPSCGSDFALNIADKEFSHTYEEIGRYTVTLTVRKGAIETSYSRSAEVVVDKSVLRNGMRKFVQIIRNSDFGNNMASAISSLFVK